MAFRYLVLLIPIFLSCKNHYEDPWGKGAELALKPKAQKELFAKKTVAGKAADSIISFYQTTISPANGPRSHFRPTSSKYMQLAIKRYGFFKGFIMGCDRLMRENDDPWVYRTIKINGIDYKFDPAFETKPGPSSLQ